MLEVILEIIYIILFTSNKKQSSKEISCLLWDHSQVRWDGNQLPDSKLGFITLLSSSTGLINLMLHVMLPPFCYPDLLSPESTDCISQRVSIRKPTYPWHHQQAPCWIYCSSQQRDYVAFKHFHFLRTVTVFTDKSPLDAVSLLPQEVGGWNTGYKMCKN